MWSRNVPELHNTQFKKYTPPPGQRLEDESVRDSHRHWQRMIRFKKREIAERASAGFRALQLMPEFAQLQHNLITPAQQLMQQQGASAVAVPTKGNIFVDFKAAAALAAREALGAATAASTGPGVGAVAASSRTNYRQWKAMAQGLNKNARLTDIYMTPDEFFDRKVYFSDTGFNSMKRRRVLPGMRIPDLIRQQNLIIGPKQANLTDLKMVMQHHLRAQEHGDLALEENRKKCLAELRKEHADAAVARREYRHAEGQFNRFREHWSQAKRKRKKRASKSLSRVDFSAGRKSMAAGAFGTKAAGGEAAEKTLLDSDEDESDEDGVDQTFSLKAMKGAKALLVQAREEEQIAAEEVGGEQIVVEEEQIVVEKVGGSSVAEKRIAGMQEV